MCDAIQVLEIIIWPAFIGAVLAFLVSKRGSRLVRTIFGATKRIKAFGLEFDLSEDDGRRFKASLEEVFTEYRDDVEAEFDRQAQRFDVSRLLARVAKEVIEPALAHRKDDYRCTIYVQDIVFTDVLYRLLNYYPGGDGKGSIYSTRFGIIGRSWRLEKSQHEDEVPTDPEKLIVEWGMTAEEAAEQSSRSYLTFLLGDGTGGPAVGVLYVEASKEAIGPEALKLLEAAESVRPLVTAVGQVMDSMRGRGPYLELFDN